MIFEGVVQMANGVFDLTETSFESEIKEGITIVDFWAPWCAPCHIQAPILEAVAKKLDGRAKFAKLNVDEARGPAMTYGIQGIPTVIIFKDGEEVQRFVGVRQEFELLGAVQNAL